MAVRHVGGDGGVFGREADGQDARPADAGNIQAAQELGLHGGLQAGFLGRRVGNLLLAVGEQAFQPLDRRQIAEARQLEAVGFLLRRHFRIELGKAVETELTDHAGRQFVGLDDLNFTFDGRLVGGNARDQRFHIDDALFARVHHDGGARGEKRRQHIDVDDAEQRHNSYRTEQQVFPARQDHQQVGQTKGGRRPGRSLLVSGPIMPVGLLAFRRQKLVHRWYPVVLHARAAPQGEHCRLRLCSVECRVSSFA